MLPWRLPAIACRHAAGGRFGKQLGLWSKFRVWTVTKLSCKYGIKIYLDLEGTSSLKMEPSWGCTSDVCPRPLDNAPPAPAVHSRQDKVNGISEHGRFLRSSRGSESLLLASKSTVNFQNIMNSRQHRGSVCSLFLSKSHDKVSWVWSRASKLPVANGSVKMLVAKPHRDSPFNQCAVHSPGAISPARAPGRVCLVGHLCPCRALRRIWWRFSASQNLGGKTWPPKTPENCWCDSAATRDSTRLFGFVKWHQFLGGLTKFVDWFCAPWGYAPKWLLCRSTPGHTWTKHHWKVGETVPLRALEKHPASYGRSAVPGEINSSRTCFPCEPLCSEMVVGGQAPKERERMKTKEKWGKNKQRTEMKVKWNWKNLNLQRMFSKPARL